MLSVGSDEDSICFLLNVLKRGRCAVLICSNGRLRLRCRWTGRKEISWKSFIRSRRSEKRYIYACYYACYQSILCTLPGEQTLENGDKHIFTFVFNFHFSCPSDYVGEYCQYQNPCTSGGGKCQNGGTCSVVMSATRAPTFQCNCPIGYTESFCEVAIPSNACNENPCKNGATCSLKSISEYICACPVGWKGKKNNSKLCF